MKKQNLSEIQKLIDDNMVALLGNFNDDANPKLLKAIDKECKHKKGTITQTDYDVFNGFTVIRVYCVDCHTLLLMEVHKGFSVSKTDIKTESVKEK